MLNMLTKRLKIKRSAVNISESIQDAGSSVTRHIIVSLADNAEVKVNYLDNDMISIAITDYENDVAVKQE